MSSVSGKEEDLLIEYLLARPEIESAVALAREGDHDAGKAKLIEELRKVLQTVPDAAASSGKRTIEEESSEQPLKKGSTATGRLTMAALEQLPSSSVCLILVGLRGSGKTTVAKILQEVLLCRLVSADRPSQGDSKGPKKAFFAELLHRLTESLTARDESSRLLIVDRPNTTRAQRSDVVSVLQKCNWKKRGGKTMLVDFTHPNDTFGYGSDGQVSKRIGEQHCAICQTRVEERGCAHEHFFPDSKLKERIASAARSADTVDATEEAAYCDARLSVELQMSPPEIARRIIERLKETAWIPDMVLDENFRDKLEVAWQAQSKAEADWREATAAKQPSPEAFRNQIREHLEKEHAAKAAHSPPSNAPGDAPAAAAAAAAGPVVAASWRLELKEVQSLLNQKKGGLPEGHRPLDNSDVLILRLSSAGVPVLGPDDREVDKEELTSIIDSFEGLENTEFEVRMSLILVEERFSIGFIDLPAILCKVSKLPAYTVLGAAPSADLADAQLVVREYMSSGKASSKCYSIPMSEPRPLTGTLIKKYHD